MSQLQKTGSISLSDVRDFLEADSADFSNDTIRDVVGANQLVFDNIYEISLKDFYGVQDTLPLTFDFTLGFEQGEDTVNYSPGNALGALIPTSFIDEEPDGTGVREVGRRVYSISINFDTRRFQFTIYGHFDDRDVGKITFPGFDGGALLFDPLEATDVTNFGGPADDGTVKRTRYRWVNIPSDFTTYIFNNRNTTIPMTINIPKFGINPNPVPMPNWAGPTAQIPEGFAPRWLQCDLRQVIVNGSRNYREPAPDFQTFLRDSVYGMAEPQLGDVYGTRNDLQVPAGPVRSYIEYQFKWEKDKLIWFQYPVFEGPGATMVRDVTNGVNRDIDIMYGWFGYLWFNTDEFTKPALIRSNSRIDLTGLTYHGVFADPDFFDHDDVEITSPGYFLYPHGDLNYSDSSLINRMTPYYIVESSMASLIESIGGIRTNDSALLSSDNLVTSVPYILPQGQYSAQWPNKTYITQGPTGLWSTSQNRTLNLGDYSHNKYFNDEQLGTEELWDLSAFNGDWDELTPPLDCVDWDFTPSERITWYEYVTYVPLNLSTENVTAGRLDVNTGMFTDPVDREDARQRSPVRRGEIFHNVPDGVVEVSYRIEMNLNEGRHLLKPLDNEDGSLPLFGNRGAGARIFEAQNLSGSSFNATTITDAADIYPAPNFGDMLTYSACSLSYPEVFFRDQEGNGNTDIIQIGVEVTLPSRSGSKAADASEAFYQEDLGALAGLVNVRTGITTELEYIYVIAKVTTDDGSIYEYPFKCFTDRDFPAREFGTEIDVFQDTTENDSNSLKLSPRFVWGSGNDVL